MALDFGIAAPARISYVAGAALVGWLRLDQLPAVGRRRFRLSLDAGPDADASVDAEYYDCSRR